jgi:GH18 family chitinase
MKRLSYSILLICCMLFGVISQAGAADKSPFRSIGYIPDWAYSGYTTLDYAALTHVNIAFCNPTSNSTTGDLRCGIPDATLKAIVQKAHDNDVKVMASLGGWGGHPPYPNFTSTPEKREMFCGKIIAYAKKYNLDGIDLDIEGDVANSFWTTYEAWVAELRDSCDANGLLLTTAVGQWYASKITTKTFTYFDFVTIMEYERYASNYQSSINYFLGRGIKAENLVLGIPFFGKYGDNEVAYKTIMKDYPDAWYINSMDGNTWHSVKDIADLAQLSRNYGGVMIWELSQDVAGDYSLLKTVKSVLYGDGSLPEVTNSVTSISISPETDEVMERKYLQLSASILPENATLKTLKWSSDKPKIASVDSKGRVRGVAEGEATITVTSVETGSTVKGTATITVIPNPNVNGDFPDIYRFISVHSNKAMEVKDNSLAIGARMQQYTLRTTDNEHQGWYFEYISGDTYRIRSKSSGLYLTAMGTGDGAKVELQALRTNTTQQWDVIETATGIYSIRTKYAAGKVLDVSGPSTANGAEVHVWTDFAANNQKWKLQAFVPATTDIEEVSKQPFSVFPNPTDGIVVVQFDAPSACYALYSISGILLKSGNLSQQSGEIDMTELSQGIYLLEVLEGNNVYYHKIVKR